jgi:hypothetical protein
MIMESRLITQLPDIILIKKSSAIGDSLSLGVDHAVGTSSTPELAPTAELSDGV